MNLLNNERQHMKFGYDAEDIMQAQNEDFRYMMHQMAENGNMDGVIFLADCDRLWKEAKIEQLKYQRDDAQKVLNEGYSHSDAAKERGTSTQSVWRNVRDAKKKIITELNDLLDKLEEGSERE